MRVEQKQFIQCFQLSVDDLKAIIEDAVKSVTPPIKSNNSNYVLLDNDSDDDLLSPKEVSAKLKISITTLWRYNRDGILKYKNKIGRKVYYSKKEVYNFINDTSQ
ncbi:helix-turn-helix transcriptional regulator [Tenacibaculum maritimum]|uniref:helix-turn-helix transcriptional regulator n=1 Tax=Tenacibaculum maritimum TaxID=107401 RepID=UPI003876326D